MHAWFILCQGQWNGGRGAIVPHIFKSVNWPATVLAYRHAVSLTHSYTLRKIHLIPIKTHKATIITVTATPIFIKSCELGNKSVRWLHSYH